MGASEFLYFLGTRVLVGVVFNGVLLLNGHAATPDNEGTACSIDITVPDLPTWEAGLEECVEFLLDCFVVLVDVVEKGFRNYEGFGIAVALVALKVEAVEPTAVVRAGVSIDKFFFSSSIVALSTGYLLIAVPFLS